MPQRFARVDDMINECKLFINKFANLVNNQVYQRSQIINMDETSINFVPEIRNTVDSIGVR